MRAASTPTGIAETPNAPRRLSLPPLRYLVAVLFLVLAGWLAYGVYVEIARSRAFEKYYASHPGEIGGYPRLPDALVERLPNDWGRFNLLWVDSITLDLNTSDRTGRTRMLAFARHFPEIETLGLRKEQLEINDETADLVKAIPNLNGMKIEAHNLRGDWSLLASKRPLERLSIQTAFLTTDRLDVFQSLKSLDIDTDRLDEVQFDQIGKLAQLTSLSFTLRTESPRNFNWLSKLTNLRELNLTIDGLTDDHIKSIASLKKLETLTIWSNGGHFQNELSGLCGLPQLQELQLCAEEISEDGLLALGRLHLLRRFVVACESARALGVPAAEDVRRRTDVEIPPSPDDFEDQG